MRQMQSVAAAETGRLLCLLLLRIGEMSADSSSTMLPVKSVLLDVIRTASFRASACVAQLFPRSGYAVKTLFNGSNKN